MSLHSLIRCHGNMKKEKLTRLSEGFRDSFLFILQFQTRLYDDQILLWMACLKGYQWNQLDDIAEVVSCSDSLTMNTNPSCHTHSANINVMLLVNHWMLSPNIKLPPKPVSFGFCRPLCV
ncbi:hypothetical protein VNO77_15307 [Canavalia gladiata]|uniref:Uncharacterized protein n=1 Tax=Canavalia gladiata TaxID=3824 RepID=A0AAN9M3V1_CANGL